MSINIAIKRKIKKHECGLMKNQSHMRPSSGTDDGVSELVAALLLTAIVTIGIGIIAVIFLSNPAPSEIPSVSVDLAKREANVVLIHDGGDPLYRQTTRIMVDGVDRTDDFKTPEGDEWGIFSTGDRMESSIPRTVNTQVLIIYTGFESPSVIQAIGKQPFTPPPVAAFTIDPASGYISQLFSFTDLSSNSPTSWSWDFGDITNSTERYPTHRYSGAGTYGITLTSCNEGGCNSTTRNITVFDFSDFITNESVFVYGTKLDFNGNTITGEGSTIIIIGDLLSADLNGGSKIYVSNVYINGSVDLSGTQYLGSTTRPELIFITGDLDMDGGSRVYGDGIFVDGDVDLDSNIYGDLYTNGSLDFNNGHIYGGVNVSGDLYLKSGRVHDDIYVDGDLTLGWTPTIDADAYIYYTGSISHPGWYPQYILDKCVHVGSVPVFSMPVFLDIPIPSPKADSWYSSNGYESGGGDLMEGIRIFSVSDYSTTQQWYYGSNNATNIVIVSKEGDITFNNFWSVPVKGVLFAPNGRVTFTGDIFEGLVIARDGFYVPSGGSDITFKNIEEYISDPDDYPF
ncbi:MAG: type IV pilin [Methanomicrobiaceae archaeon]|nr:type IV pilin [Methanomicrobiaceae archaeon]